ncbi:hypothetical protein H4F44_25420, partial [Escherichia coli]
MPASTAAAAFAETPPPLDIERGASLRAHNTFGLPCVAQTLVRLHSEADVRRVVNDPELGPAPKFVLGGGSNLVLTRDVDL